MSVRCFDVRWPCLTAFVLLTALLSACGGESTSRPSPPGSPDNPLVAVTPDDTSAGGVNEGAAPKKAAKAPSYQSLVEGQGRKPRSRFTPCNLVTKAQAQAIVGQPFRDPLEAPRGPTCLYRTKDGKRLITLAVQPLELARLKGRVHDRRQVKVADRTAFCGTLGAPVVYVALSKTRVLSVAAPCDVGTRFATTAVRRLDG
jgi:hypothetical protein